MTTDFLTLYDSDEAHEIISEDAFGRILAPFSSALLALSYYVEEAAAETVLRSLNMEFLAHIIKYASDVEHLMDRYRARNNKNWFYFRELAATAKNFGKAAFLLEEFKKNTHMERLLPEDTASIAMTDTGSRFFSEIICRTFRELQAEAKRLDLTIPKQKPLLKYGVKLPNKIFLPHTIEERTSSDRMHTVKKLTHRFAEFVEEVAGSLGSLEELTKRSEDLAPAVPGKINEGTLRRLGTRLHNFQSWYDSYIAHSRIEDEMPELKTLRDIFSAQLNLFKIATILAHYFERHLLFPSSLVVDSLRDIVPPSRLIENVLYFCLYYIVQLSYAGKALDAAILSRLVETVTYELPVPKTLGFHARPSTRVAKVVQHHGADVKMLVDDQVFNAGSVLEMLSAGGYILTKQLDRVHFRGDRQALDDLKILAGNNYGETFDGKDVVLPDALSYLR